MKILAINNPSIDKEYFKSKGLNLTKTKEEMYEDLFNEIIKIIYTENE